MLTKELQEIQDIVNKSIEQYENHRVYMALNADKEVCVLLPCTECGKETCIHPLNDYLYQFSEHFGTINGKLQICQPAITKQFYNILIVHVK